MGLLHTILTVAGPWSAKGSVALHSGGRDGFTITVELGGTGTVNTQRDKGARSNKTV
ncbi:MAG: hypothetical protein QW434_03960 [Pyrobaculum sp.]